MGWGLYVLAGGVAAIVTAAELSVQWRPKPLFVSYPGTVAHHVRRFRAQWFSLLIVDAVVAAGLWFFRDLIDSLIGAAPPEEAPSWFAAAFVGALGPLALRAPFWRRRRRPGEQDSDRFVGLIVVYDGLLRALFLEPLRGHAEEIERGERHVLRQSASERGWTPVSVRGRIESSLTADPTRDGKNLREDLRNAMTAQGESSQFDGLLTACQKYRLSNVLSALAHNDPDTTDVEAGKTADEDLRRDLEYDQEDVRGFLELVEGRIAGSVPRRRWPR